MARRQRMDLSIFETSCHLLTCQQHVGGFTLSLWLLNVKQGSFKYQPLFIVLGLTRLGIEPESTTSVADALSTWPLISNKLFWENLSTCWLNRMLKGTLTCTQVALLHPWIKHKQLFPLSSFKTSSKFTRKAKANQNWSTSKRIFLKGKCHCCLVAIR